MPAKVKRGPGYWKMNTSCLENPAYDELITVTTAQLFLHQNHRFACVEDGTVCKFVSVSQPPPSITIIITATTICHYYHQSHHHLSLSLSEPPPSVTIIIRATTNYYYYHHNHHHMSLLYVNKILSRQRTT